MVYIFLIPCLSEHLFFDGKVIETKKTLKGFWIIFSTFLNPDKASFVNGMQPCHANGL